MPKQLRELTGYGLGGGFAFIVTTAILLLAERTHWPHLIAAIVAYTIGFIINFVWQVLVTFRTGNNQVASRLFRFALIQLFGFALFVALIAFLVKSIKLHYFVAYLTAVTITFALNFVLSKLIAFAPAKPNRQELRQTTETTKPECVPR